ncbi:FxLYD domain-containing protein [Micromonospora echinaurantiaca]|uniref:FxLYD domain-containing protein n=1 Tax=Micromonospora echinaurantiaca TaxID=47857 RepID=UPI00379E746F
MSHQTPAPSPEFTPAPPPKKGMSTGLKVFLIIAGLSVLLCGGGFVACTALVGKAANDVSKDQAAKVGHVKLNTCEVDSASSDLLPNVTFDIEVNNSSDDQNTYLVDVFVFDAAGTRVGNTTEVISDVRPGQKSVQEGTILLSQKVSGKISCKIDKVS